MVGEPPRLVGAQQQGRLQGNAQSACNGTSWQPGTHHARRPPGTNASSGSARQVATARNSGWPIRMEAEGCLARRMRMDRRIRPPAASIWGSRVWGRGCHGQEREPAPAPTRVSSGRRSPAASRQPTLSYHPAAMHASADQAHLVGHHAGVVLEELLLKRLPLWRKVPLLSVEASRQLPAPLSAVEAQQPIQLQRPRQRHQLPRPQPAQQRQLAQALPS